VNAGNSMQKLLQNFLLAGITILIVFLCIEIILRCIGFAYPSFYRYDKAAGAALRPDAEGWWREEGEGFVKINTCGMRDDREISKEKPSGIYRIAVLGDSFAEAFQIDVKDAFWRVLENELNACKAFSGKEVEVLNFGVSGYSTTQELLALRSRVWDFHPDMVLLAFFTGNDVRDNQPALCQIQPCPFFILHNGTLSLDQALFQSTAFRIKSSRLYQQAANLLDNFRLYQFAKKTKKIFLLNKAAQSPQIALQAQQPAATGTSQTMSAPGKWASTDAGLDDAVYCPPRAQAWHEAWRITEALLEQMHKEVMERGARFLLVTLTNGIQVNPDQKVRAAYAHTIGGDDLLYPDKRLASFADNHGIAHIMLAPAMQKYADQTGRYLHGFSNTSMGTGHWNVEGHHVAGDIIARYFCDAATPEPFR
jgi:hypothetical protein